MITEPTSGPWEIVPKARKDGFFEAQIVSGSRLICTAKFNDAGNEGESNANLMACASELAVSLHTLVEALTGEFDKKAVNAALENAIDTMDQINDKCFRQIWHK